jgi:transposase-like protein
MTKAEHQDISGKLRVLNNIQESGNVSRTCRCFGISRENFYQWKYAYKRDGERVLINSRA